jgi:hypothetical protein
MKSAEYCEFVLRPSREQAKALREAILASRIVYNEALEQRKKANDQRERVSTIEQSRWLTKRRKNDPLLRRVSRICLQATLNRIDAYTMKHRCLPQYASEDEFGAVFNSGVRIIGPDEVKLPKIGKIRCPGVIQSPEFKTAVITRSGGKWILRTRLYQPRKPYYVNTCL